MSGTDRSAGSPSSANSTSTGATLKETERIQGGGGPGRGGPMGGGMVGQKASTFLPSARRLVGRLRPERRRAVTVVVLAVASVVLTAFGPRLLGRATDLIFAGLLGQRLPGGTTKAQAVAGLRERGEGRLADLVSGVDLVPGRGVDFTAVGHVLVLVLGVYVVAFALAWLQGYLLNDVVQGTVRRMRADVEDKINRLPLSYFDRQPRGELMSRVTNDIDNISQTLQQTMSQLLTSLLTVVAVVAMMIAISPLLSLVALVSVPLSILLTRTVMRRSQGLFVQQWRSTGRLNAHVEETFSGHALVKVFGRQREVDEAFDRENDALFTAAFGAQFVSGLIMPIMMFLGNLQYVVVAVLGGLRVASGAISLGDVQAFVQYSRQFTQPLTQVASMTNLLQSGVASAERVFELLDAEEESPDVAVAGVAGGDLTGVAGSGGASVASTPSAPSSLQGGQSHPRFLSPSGPAPAGHVAAGSVPAGHVAAGSVPAGHVAAGSVPSGPVAGGRRGEVVFEDVAFSYDAERPLIEDLSLVARPGQTVAIVGPTGAGKTTLVNLVMRFYEVGAGRITLDGVDVRDLPRAVLRGQIGMVLQDTWLFAGSIRDNIAYGRPDAAEEEVLEAARATFVDRFVHSLPDGYDTVVDEDGSSLSAGERQLVTIARAFLADPALLILDEATSSVDTRTELLVQQAMAALRTDRTSFVIAHRLSTIRDADLILVMEEGSIVEQGSHDELLAAGGAYARLHRSQFTTVAV